MNSDFEVLDYQSTPIGDISLRRRRILMLDGIEVYEVKLGNEFLMSSLFHEVEVALADLGIATQKKESLDVVVGGLGLGYTAVAALKHPQVKSLLVVEFLSPVVDWHKRGLVPLGPTLINDTRCRFVLNDFFALAMSESGFDSEQPNRKLDAILLDIDHSPSKLLHPQNSTFYQRDGLSRITKHLHPHGVFALWSDDPPDNGFLQKLEEVFFHCQAHVVKFHNPFQDKDSASTVYVACQPKNV